MAIILSDIGGTHVRFAIGHEGKILNPQKLRAADFGGFEDALEQYLSGSEHRPKTIAAATAAWPNEEGRYVFSNLSGWDFDPQVLKEGGYTIERVCNDFEAASYGALSLPDHEIKVLRSGHDGRQFPRIICGPGTGLGLAYALPDGKYAWRVQPTFGAHMLPSCVSEEQRSIIAAAHRFGNSPAELKFEDICSGRGLPLLHKAVCAVFDLKEVGHSTVDILAHQDAQATQMTLQYFHEFWGLFINNAILTTHGFGGVYLNGGLLDRLMEKNLFDFDKIQKFMYLPLIEYVDHIMKDVPVYYVSDPFLALKGLMEISNNA